ncbi:Multiple RNA-binding domain-containing protein 1 [Sesamum angolense]|uniref:Multiple RNA-binding domain-containing protein 1 n=1 Tax=Sesamum angolense TaxID=2727404 RepID=A0AAE1WUS5_9LAMI|nr:Multiple RNA-binding domain-containing protein 1 [Sesamum angolense]
MWKSRICVKNLPKYVAEDRLRDFFSQKGEVTDAKLMRTKDGKSRQFGFVGFRTDHEAQEAINYFNKSFIDTCRITCEIARKVGDPNMPRPWSQHSLKKKENSSEEEKRVTSSKDPKTVVLEGKSKKSKNKKDDENDDPQLQEFLQVMQHRSRSKLWANDTPEAPSLEQSEIASANKVQMTKRREEIVDGEDIDLEGIKGKELTEGDEHGNGDYDDSTDSQNKRNRGPVQDTLEFDVSRGEAEDGSSGECGIDSSVDPSSSQENKNEKVLESGRLFIRNLPYTATEEDLEEYFSKYGTISQVHIVIDKDTRRSKGIAFVLFALPESAARALEEMDSSIFQGRLLHVMPAKQKNLSDTQQANDPGSQSSKTFKQQRDAERKASEASGNTRAWNSLFMRPDTHAFVDYLLSMLYLLIFHFDSSYSSIGETQVIAETKKALSSAGVNISSLEEFAAGKTDGLKRSNHVILVKNLPYGSSESELSNMFGKFGSLDRIVLPPTKTLALVIFLEPAEARAAFKGLAYKRYKLSQPIYSLELCVSLMCHDYTRFNAPDYNVSDGCAAISGVGTWQYSQSNLTVGDNKVVGEHDVKRALLEQEVEETTDADVDLDRIEVIFYSVYSSMLLHLHAGMVCFKLDFSLFSETAADYPAVVLCEKHVKNGKNVSMGFGFIEFDSVDTAVSVCRTYRSTHLFLLLCQGTVLDGHALILQLCHAKKDEVLPRKVENDISSTKLIVRNVAFEATEKDLRQLFSPFGQIKSLRLPMRFGKHRGFAFVEYVTKQEARNALQALSNTHLYGRHLVLERAKEGESLEELRARTAAQFTDSDSAKLSKKRKHLTVLDEGNIKFERIAE